MLDLDDETGIDELVRKELIVPVREFGLELDRARVRVDLVVYCHKGAGCEFLLMVPVVRLDRKPHSAPVLAQYLREIVFGEGKDHRDRLHLGDHRKPACVVRMNDVARVHLAQPDAAADRRNDARIDQLQFGVVDLALVGLYRSFILTYQGFLSIELLAGDQIFLDQVLEPHQVDFGIVEQSLIAGHGPLCLAQLHLEGPRIDFGQEFAFAYDLAFPEKDLRQLSVDAGLYRDGVHRRDRPETGQINAEIVLLHGNGHDRHSPAQSQAPAGRRVRLFDRPGQRTGTPRQPRDRLWPLLSTNG